MGRRTLACWLSAVLLATGTACGADGGGARGDCDEADPAVVKEIMAGARTDFRPVQPDGSPGIQVDHLELLESGVGELPEKDREFGAEQLLVLKISTFLAGEDASDGFERIDGTVSFALDDDGDLLGPAGTFSASLFDLPSPPEPGWLAWGDKVEVSALANDLFVCVNPG